MRRSILDLAGPIITMPLRRAVDHPGNAELVDAHARKALVKKVLPKGMLAAPPSLAAPWKLRSASATSLIVIEIAKPGGLWKWDGGASEAMIHLDRPSTSSARMIFCLRSRR